MSRVSSQAGATTSEGRDPRRPWVPPAFTRLARVHALSVAGDTMFMAAMAGTVFFSVADFDEARGRVALLLLFTIAPFAVAAPLVGPLLDRARGGRRMMIIAISLARATLCFLLIRHRQEWLFYPEALGFLVASKGYLIARGAVVPTTVRSDSELVKANARLTLLSGVTAAVAAGPALLLLWLGGPGWILALAFLVFITAAGFATQLPKARVAESPADEAEKAELRSIGILIAASSMGAVRIIVGFLVFQVGFYAKDNNLPILIAAAAGTAQVGFLVGSVIAPIMRRHFTEERMLATALSVTVAAAAGAALIGFIAAGSDIVLGLAAAMLTFGVGVTANVAKQAFDAIVQRDAPDANRGRSFARFETRFQLVWVLGALIPTAIVLPMELGFVVVMGIAAFSLLSYLIGRRRAAVGEDPRLVRLPLPDWDLEPEDGSERSGWVRAAARVRGVMSTSRPADNVAPKRSAPAASVPAPRTAPPTASTTALPPPPNPPPTTRRRFFGGRLSAEPPEPNPEPEPNLPATPPLPGFEPDQIDSER